MNVTADQTSPVANNLHFALCSPSQSGERVWRGVTMATATAIGAMTQLLGSPDAIRADQ